jgi:long-chain acyl-CoA synthetase
VSRRPGGDHASNNRYFVVSYLAVVGAGMVAVPIDPTTPALAVKEERRGAGSGADRRPVGQALVTANTEGALDDVEFVIRCGFTRRAAPPSEKLIECEPTDRVELTGMPRRARLHVGHRRVAQNRPSSATLRCR